MIPCDPQQFQYLIDREVLIVRNIPKTLSSETLFSYFSHFGGILDFQVLNSQSSQSHYQALVLMKNLKDAIHMQNAKISTIGGFYLERISWEKHSFLLLDQATESPPVALAAEPDYTFPNASAKTSDDFENDRNLKSLEADDLFEIDFQSTKELGQQLLQGYAQVLASSYLAVSNIVDQFGIRGMLLFLFSLFRVLIIYKALLQFFRVDMRVKKLVDLAKESKKIIASTPAGKPIIDQIDLVIGTANDLVVSTQKIISQKSRQIREA